MANYPSFPLDPTGLGGYGRLAPGTSRSSQPRVLTNNFGGGYQQRVGDGVNANKRVVSARWENLDQEGVDRIEAFFAERAGYKPFTHPYPGEAAPMQFICTTWSTVWNDAFYASITATFEENFDP